MLGVNTKLLILFIVLTATLVLFVWNRWRYDIVALVALLVVAVAGLVPPNQVLAGLISPSEIYKSIYMSVILFGDYWRMGLPLLYWL
ncbi:MAG: hypothetical protein A2W17_02030 [Planctomycetes bacterium RBG_16_41_13]|nr:MAG: hypothetical protein A2W17_02030 [Planctomycetes bacterium RBG_16_41_13]